MFFFDSLNTLQRICLAISKDGLLLHSGFCLVISKDYIHLIDKYLKKKFCVFLLIFLFYCAIFMNSIIYDYKFVVQLYFCYFIAYLKKENCNCLALVVGCYSFSLNILQHEQILFLLFYVLNTNSRKTVTYKQHVNGK